MQRPQQSGKGWVCEWQQPCSTLITTAAQALQEVGPALVDGPCAQRAPTTDHALAAPKLGGSGRVRPAAAAATELAGQEGVPHRRCWQPLGGALCSLEGDPGLSAPFPACAAWGPCLLAAIADSFPLYKCFADCPALQDVCLDNPYLILHSEEYQQVGLRQAARMPSLKSRVSAHRRRRAEQDCVDALPAMWL